MSLFRFRISLIAVLLFSGLICLQCREKRMGRKDLMNKESEEITHPKYRKLEEKFGMVIYEMEGRKQGVVDLKGNDLLGRTYEFVQIINADEVMVFEEKWKIINLKKRK